MAPQCPEERLEDMVNKHEVILHGLDGRCGLIKDVNDQKEYLNSLKRLQWIGIAVMVSGFLGLIGTVILKGTRP